MPMAKFEMPHPATFYEDYENNPQFRSVIAGMEQGTYPLPDVAIWREDLPLPLRIRLAKATGATDEQIAEMRAADQELNVPHVMVTWSNAITTRPGDSECFADRDIALAAASDGRRPWNNTRVDVCWHEAHDRAAARRARTDAHYKAKPVHVWGITCAECAAITADRDAADAEVKAARDAAGDHDLHAVTS